jgi:hypothetical protein
MSRAASPFVKVGFLLAVLLMTGARVRTADAPACTREITRCLSACRAVCGRRISENERLSKQPVRGGGSAGSPFPPLTAAYPLG